MPLDVHNSSDDRDEPMNHEMSPVPFRRSRQTGASNAHTSSNEDELGNETYDEGMYGETEEIESPRANSPEDVEEAHFNLQEIDEVDGQGGEEQVDEEVDELQDDEMDEDDEDKTGVCDLHQCFHLPS